MQNVRYHDVYTKNVKGKVRFTSAYALPTGCVNRETSTRMLIYFDSLINPPLTEGLMINRVGYTIRGEAYLHVFTNQAGDAYTDVHMYTTSIRRIDNKQHNLGAVPRISTALKECLKVTLYELLNDIAFMGAGKLADFDSQFTNLDTELSRALKEVEKYNNLIKQLLIDKQRYVDSLNTQLQKQ